VQLQIVPVIPKLHREGGAAVALAGSVAEDSIADRDNEAWEAQLAAGTEKEISVNTY
jgi:hypothetical protein